MRRGDLAGRQAAMFGRKATLPGSGQRKRMPQRPSVVIWMIGGIKVFGPGSVMVIITGP